MIVKNLMAVGMIATVATVASAADEAKANWGVNGKIRMDAVQSSTDTTPAGGTKSTTKSSEIMLKRAQFSLTGERGGDTMSIKYYAESNTLDTATITHKFTDTVNVAFGKMGVLAQSWENDYSSTDQYITSMAGTMTPDNSVGAQANASFGDHAVSLQLVNGVNSITTAATATEAESTETFNKGGSLTTALQYKGEINKMIRPIFTYTSVKTSGTQGKTGDVVTSNRSNGYQTQMGLGVQVDVAGLVADVEYDTVKMHKLKLDVESTTNKDTDVNAMILQAKYAIGMTTPFLKFVSEAKKLGQENGIGDVTGTQMALGVEHKLDSNCRLHAVYFSNATSTKASSTESEKMAKGGFNLGVTAAM